MIESGTSLPVTATAAPGSLLVKVVPKGDGVTPYSPYWMTPEQARAIFVMTPDQAANALGLPAAQAAKMLEGGLDFFAITPKQGVMPKVFVSDIAPTAQGATTITPSGQQVLVPNRSLWSEPKKIDPLKVN